jgi:hypothetical protein
LAEFDSGKIVFAAAREREREAYRRSDAVQPMLDEPQTG